MTFLLSRVAVPRPPCAAGVARRVVLGALLLCPAASGAQEAPPRGAFLGDLTWPEAAERLASAPLVVVPMGAGAKEHGPHLPLRTDQLMLEHLMQAAVDSLPVVVAPPVLHGWFAAFEEWPGTHVGDPDVFRRYMEGVARSLIRHGARRVVFLNTGVSKATGLPISIAAREIRTELGVPTLVVSWDDLEPPEVEALAEQEAGGHGGEVETSVVLFLRPDLVHMDRAPTDYRGGAVPGLRGYRPGIFSRDPSDPDHSDTGIFGDARLATPEKGRRVVELMTREWLATLRAFATVPLPD